MRSHYVSQNVAFHRSVSRARMTRSMAIRFEKNFDEKLSDAPSTHQHCIASRTASRTVAQRSCHVCGNTRLIVATISCDQNYSAKRNEQSRVCHLQMLLPPIGFRARIEFSEPCKSLMSCGNSILRSAEWRMSSGSLRPHKWPEAIAFVW